MSYNFNDNSIEQFNDLSNIYPRHKSQIADNLDMIQY